MPKEKNENEASTSMLKATLFFFCKNVFVGLWAAIVFSFWWEHNFNISFSSADSNISILEIAMWGSVLIPLFLIHFKWYRKAYFSNPQEYIFYKLLIGFVSIFIFIGTQILSFNIYSFLQNLGG